MQRNQQRLWLEEQMKEKARANHEKMHSEKMIQAAMLARDQKAKELEDAEKNSRREMLTTNAKYNLELVSPVSLL